MLEPLPLLVQLVQTILLPTLLGAAIRGFVPGGCLGLAAECDPLQLLITKCAAVECALPGNSLIVLASTATAFLSTDSHELWSACLCCAACVQVRRLS